MRILIIISLLMMSVSAMAAPTIYGKIAQEISMIDVKDLDTDADLVGADDINASESRVGVKGSFNVHQLTATYLAEIAVNPSRNAGIGLRLRQSFMTLGGNFGTLVLGQAYTATAKVGLGLDALSHTSASLAGVGHLYSGIKRITGFKTANYAGFQYYVTHHLAADMNNTIARSKDNVGHLENLFSYATKFGNVNTKFYAAYNMIDDDETTDDTAMMFGTKVTFGDFTIGALYTMAEETEVGDTDALENTRMLGSVAYKLDKNIFALTYGTQKYAYGTGGDEPAETQITVGYKRVCSKNLNLTAYYSMNTDERSFHPITGELNGKRDTDLETNTMAVGINVLF